jgi:hypothetical protein
MKAKTIDELAQEWLPDNLNRLLDLIVPEELQGLTHYRGPTVIIAIQQGVSASVPQVQGEKKARAPKVQKSVQQDIRYR